MKQKPPRTLENAPVHTTTVAQWGNGLAVRISRSLAAASGVKNGSAVKISAEPGRIVVEAVERRATLEELLVRFDPARHGGEAIVDRPVGREIVE